MNCDAFLRRLQSSPPSTFNNDCPGRPRPPRARSWRGFALVWPRWWVRKLICRMPVNLWLMLDHLRHKRLWGARVERRLVFLVAVQADQGLLSLHLAVARRNVMMLTHVFARHIVKMLMHVLWALPRGICAEMCELSNDRSHILRVLQNTRASVQTFIHHNMSSRRHTYVCMCMRIHMCYVEAVRFQSGLFLRLGEQTHRNHVVYSRSCTCIHGDTFSDVFCGGCVCSVLPCVFLILCLRFIAWETNSWFSFVMTPNVSFGTALR